MREHVITLKIYFIRYFIINFNGGILIMSTMFAITLRSILQFNYTSKNTDILEAAKGTLVQTKS